MTLVAEQLSSLADRLWLARIERQPCSALTDEFAELSTVDAYNISRLNLERRLKEGEQLVGRKIGLTSVAVQKQLSVDRPDFGYLTSGMRIADGARLPEGSLLQGKVEGETAFILKSPLRGPGVDVSDVFAATQGLAACIEIIDSRVRDWKIRIQDTIADNASSAFFVLGSPVPPERVDLEKATMRLRIAQELRSSGQGTACLGHPARAVAWLANALGELGDGLAAGDVVLSGAFGPVVPFRPGDRCEVEIDGLGKVSCSY